MKIILSNNGEPITSEGKPISFSVFAWSLQKDSQGCQETHYLCWLKEIDLSLGAVYASLITIAHIRGIPLLENQIILRFSLPKGRALVINWLHDRHIPMIRIVKE